jgi:hypothetical protein
MVVSLNRDIMTEIPHLMTVLSLRGKEMVLDLAEKREPLFLTISLGLVVNDSRCSHHTGRDSGYHRPLLNTNSQK